MKTIGRTEDGYRLVAMTEDEHQLFKALENVLNGGIWEDLLVSGRGSVDTDLSGAFKALSLFVDLGLKVNSIQKFLDEIKEVCLPKTYGDDYRYHGKG